MIAGMRDILWQKDAMCNTITSIDTLPALQNANGRFKYTIPCYVLPRDSAKLELDMQNTADKTQRYVPCQTTRGLHNVPICVSPRGHIHCRRHPLQKAWLCPSFLFIYIYIYIYIFEVGVVFRSRLTCSFICADGHDHIEFFSYFFFTYYVYIGTWLNHLGEAKVTASTLPPPLTRYVCAHYFSYNIYMGGLCMRMGLSTHAR